MSMNGSNNAVRIGDIDLGCIARQFNDRAGFTGQTMESHIEDVARALNELKLELTRAVEKLYSAIGRGQIVAGDGPTDLIWILSLTLMVRTLGMLGSKSKDLNRDQANRSEHNRFLDRYLLDVNQILSRKADCAELFPYRTS